jgi:hypothetical protein
VKPLLTLTPFGSTPFGFIQVFSTVRSTCKKGNQGQKAGEEEGQNMHRTSILQEESTCACMGVSCG